MLQLRLLLVPWRDQWILKLPPLLFGWQLQRLLGSAVAQVDECCKGGDCEEADCVWVGRG